MSSALLALALMQFVVSVKAGLVNHVQGTATVTEMDMVQPGQPIRTARDGYAEVLLTPGSFLRIGENSAVVLDGVELQSVSLRVVEGPAVIEVIDIDKDYPIRVTTGQLSMDIVAPGIYRFSDGVATVLDGKLQTADSQFSYKKGWQVFFQDNYRARKTGQLRATSLDVYSQGRSLTIAAANATLASQINPASAMNSYWLYAPVTGFYTFIPLHNYRSPYGYRYYSPARRVIYRGDSGSSSGGYSGGSTNTGSTNNTGGNSGGDSGGGGGGGAPAITVSTPAGEPSTPAVYIESKSTPVGATQ